MPELGWEDVDPVDMIGLEVGYRLIPLVDRQRDGALVARIKGVRKKLTEDLGFLVSAVHIRDNLDLAPNAYRISLMGVPVGEGEVHIDKELAINPGQVFGKINGIETRIRHSDSRRTGWSRHSTKRRRCWAIPWSIPLPSSRPT